MQHRHPHTYADDDTKQSYPNPQSNDNDLTSNDQSQFLISQSEKSSRRQAWTRLFFWSKTRNNSRYNSPLFTSNISRLVNKSKSRRPGFKRLSQLCIFLLMLFGTYYIFFNSSNGLRRDSEIYFKPISEEFDSVFSQQCRDPVLEASKRPRENATFVVLARNSDLKGVLTSMQSLESRFNQWFEYPYTFLNDQPFTSDFKAAVLNATKAKCAFHEIPQDMWDFPQDLDIELAREEIAMQGDRGIMYGGAESYHKMCRFFSGKFQHHPALLDYEWYWRIEPDVTFFCDITYDPFYYMRIYDKKYGFVIAIRELVETVPNMFRYAQYYKRKNNIESKGLWEMFLTNQPSPQQQQQQQAENDNPHSKARSKLVPPLQLQHALLHRKSFDLDLENVNGENYNMCHFWSNFEIGNFDWLRSKEYSEFFKILDDSGGFWAERWGDAPVHSLAAGIILSPKQVHYFRDFGYQHTDIAHCPQNLGCRCECKNDLPPEVEHKEGGCIDDWARVNGGYL